MKIFIAFLAIALAAAEAGYAPAWPSYGAYGKAAALPAWPYANDRWNSWNGWNAWDGQDHLDYPYAHRAWSPAYGHNTVVQANLGKGYPYGLPWGKHGAEPHGWAGHGYNHGGYVPSVGKVSKHLAATPGSLHVAAVPVGW